MDCFTHGITAQARIKIGELAQADGGFAAGFLFFIPETT
jgi:hypothetical protein